MILYYFNEDQLISEKKIGNLRVLGTPLVLKKAHVVEIGIFHSKGILGANCSEH